MHILLIEDHVNADAPFLTTLERVAEANVVRRATSIQEGIEILELQEEAFDLVICDYHGTSNILMSTLLSLADDVPCVVCVDSEENRLALAKQFPQVDPARLIPRSVLNAEFPVVMDQLLRQHALGDLTTPDAEFVRVKPELLIGASPITADVYIRLSDHKYCKLFRKGDTFDSKDLERYRDRKKVEFFFLRKEHYLKFLDKQDSALNDLIKQPGAPDAELEGKAAFALESLHNLVDRMGFTPGAQKLAKTSVQATLKLIGSRPQLSAILGRMRQDQGKYITSHSLVLAQISCALAHRIGWTSAPTYLKLTLASFLHDLPLKNNDLSRCATLQEAQTGGFTDEEVRAFKMHPMLAAEYAREFQEIPADVDTILMQHHERPDGTGFPRGLQANRLSPLSCLFIIAHDLLQFSLGEGSMYPDQFFALKGSEYNAGPFKKIMRALESDTPADSGGVL